MLKATIDQLPSIIQNAKSEIESLRPSDAAACSPSFVAHDWCGFREQYGRFTHIPSGDTLVCQGWFAQKDWDKAQLEWFEKLDGELIVHKCPTGSYRETGDTMGSVSEIVGKLRSRFPENDQAMASADEKTPPKETTL